MYKGGSHYPQTIRHASLKVDGGCFLKIFRRARNLADAKSKHHGLRNHLIVKNKIIRVFQERQGFQQSPRESAKSGVVFRELHTEK